MKRKAVLIIFILLLIAFLTYQYVNKAHRNIAEEKAVLTIESSKFYASFNENRDEFNRNYLDKTVQIQGKITSLEDNSLVLDTKNYIGIKDSITNLKLNDRITVKGRYVGYDDLLEQLKIDQATIIKD